MWIEFKANESPLLKLQSMKITCEIIKVNKKEICGFIKPFSQKCPKNCHPILNYIYLMSSRPKESPLKPPKFAPKKFSPKCCYYSYCASQKLSSLSCLSVVVFTRFSNLNSARRGIFFLRNLIGVSLSRWRLKKLPSVTLPA